MYKSIVDYLRMKDENRDKQGIVIEFNGNKITRKEYWEKVEQYKNFFLEEGFYYGCQKPVVICNYNTPEYEFMYIALLEIGAIVSTVGLPFFEDDMKREVMDKGADTIILSAEYISDNLKKEFKEMQQLYGNKFVERVIFTSKAEYKDPAKADLYNIVNEFEKKIKQLELPKQINTFSPSDLKRRIEGQSNIIKNNNELLNMLDFIATYSNTAGTSSGVPKCAVHTHRAVINLFKAHEPDNFPDFTVKEGDKTLLLIPISHITSQYYSLLLRRAIGANIVYNIDAFEPSKLANVLIENEINDVVAPFGLYVALANSPLKKGDLRHLRPSCGGEVTPLESTKRVNERLTWAGAKKIVVGGGSTEFGSVTMTAYGIEDRTNETGIAISGVDAKIINPLTRKEVKEGERGILYKTCSWQMKEYLNDQKATAGFYNYTDENGKVFGTNNDIAAVVRRYNGKPVHLLSGRATDFVIPCSKTKRYRPGVNIVDGKIEPVDLSLGKFLFDMRDVVLNLPGVIEAEAILVPYNDNDKSGVPVIDLVVSQNKSLIKILEDAYNTYLTNSDFIPEGLLFLTNFERSLASDKRETKSLKKLRGPYFWMNKKGEIVTVKIPENNKPKTEELNDLDIISIVKPPKPEKVLVKKYENIKRNVK